MMAHDLRQGMATLVALLIRLTAPSVASLSQPLKTFYPSNCHLASSSRASLGLNIGSGQGGRSNRPAAARSQKGLSLPACKFLMQQQLAHEIISSATHTLTSAMSSEKGSM